MATDLLEFRTLEFDEIELLIGIADGDEEAAPGLVANRSLNKRVKNGTLFLAIGSPG